MKNLFDAHNHCQFSFDGKRTTAERSTKAALEKGLGGIVFTDHCEIEVPTIVPEGEEHFIPLDIDIRAQQAEIERVQELMGDSIKVLKGIEIGMSGTYRDDTFRILSEYEFDQVIASVHTIESTDPYYGSFFVGKDWKTAYGAYIETICNEMRALGDFDIIGHYDYVARYAPYPQDGIMYRDFSDLFDTMFRYLIENGKGFEINTKSNAGSRGRKTFLDKEVLIRYRELGGEVISLGSDSHVPENVADNFPYHAELLKSIGFRWSSHYEKRKLVQLPL